MPCRPKGRGRHAIVQSGQEEFGDDVRPRLDSDDRLQAPVLTSRPCTTGPARQLLPLRASDPLSNSRPTECLSDRSSRADADLLGTLDAQGEFILVIDAPLAACPRRPADGSFALVNSGPNPRIYKLNVAETGKDLVSPNIVPGENAAQAAGAAGKSGNGVLVNRDGGFEFQRERFFRGLSCRQGVAWHCHGLPSTLQLFRWR